MAGRFFRLGARPCHPEDPRIPVVKIGKLLRFQAEDICEFIESISGLEAERK